MKTKKFIFFLPLLAMPFLTMAQVKVVAFPAKGFENRIRTYVDTMTIVDTHEHLTTQRGIANSKMCDFMLMLHQYSDDDIKSAGMSKPAFEQLLKDSLTVSQKWALVKPFWDNSFNTGYNRATLLAADRLFGIQEFNEATIPQLSAKIKEAYKTDWYKKVLRDLCKIEFLIDDVPERDFPDKDMMRFTQRFNYFQIDGAEKLMNLTSIDGSPVKNVDDLVALQNRDFVEALKKGFTCIKTSVAYFRSLYFEDVTKEKAEVCFQMILRSRDKQLPFEAVKPLSDYMMHRMLDLALKYDKPVQIHTGLQAGDGNIIQNSNPALLANLFLKYRNVKFVLFHGGYPYGGEFGSLAKNFRNVYIDLCWVYIISPSYSERYLHEWLETVPANKIMAFGGDYENVENIYGHLLFARQILGNVLVQKVRDGYFTEREAIRVAQMVLHDNAVQLFHLQHI